MYFNGNDLFSGKIYATLVIALQNCKLVLQSYTHFFTSRLTKKHRAGVFG